MDIWLKDIFKRIAEIIGALCLIDIDEFDLHICRACDGKCGMCYVGKEKADNRVFGRQPRYGKTWLLKLVIRNAVKAMGAKTIVFVGGDPCRHPDLVELIGYAKSFDGVSVGVLSNTHVYRLHGKYVPVGEVVTKYGLDEVDFTLHGATAEEHDAFNECPGSYDNGVRRLKEFVEARGDDPDKSVAIVINLIPETMGAHGEVLDGIMRSIIKKLNMDPKRDYFMFQRIAPTGYAARNYERWAINPEALIGSLAVMRHIQEDLGYRICLDTVDVLPWCVIPEEYHDMLHEGGCRWGHPGGILSGLPNGKIQRCALSERMIGNALLMPHSLMFGLWMTYSPTLRAFRAHKHLGRKCRKCEMLEKCGGACVIAAGRGDPYKYSAWPKKGCDYLAK